MTEINLRDQQFGLGKQLVCTRARWWNDNTKFVVVDFEQAGLRSSEDAGFSLRLDLDKRTFIDHAENSSADQIIQSNAANIWRTIVERKSGHQIDFPDVTTFNPREH